MWRPCRNYGFGSLPDLPWRWHFFRQLHNFRPTKFNGTYVKKCFRKRKQMLKFRRFHRVKWGVGKDGNLPANATTERNSGGTTMTMTGRMTVCFHLVEIDGNRCGNVKGWSTCLPVWQSLPIKHRLDEHIVWHWLFFHQTSKYNVISYWGKKIPFLAHF